MMNSCSIRAVIWDMGGVLLRTETLHSRIKLAQDLGVTHTYLNELIFSSESSRQSETGEIPSTTHWQIVAEELGLPGSAVDELREKWFSGDQVDQVLINYIKDLCTRYKTGLLSNAWQGIRDYIDSKYGFLDAFDQVLFSYEAGLRKPDQRIFNLMLSLLEVKPDEAVFIDDFKINVDGAKKTGINALQFFSTSQIMDDLNNILQE